jgi:transposase, IS5 family
MFKSEHKQKSFFGDSIYERVVPKDNFLRKLKDIIDFSFVDNLCKDLYSKEMGRPAYPPSFMFKIVFLQFMYNLSDRQVEDEVSINMAMKFFLGMDVDELPPDSTSLVVFRNRLGPERFKEIFNRIVEEARAKGLIEDKLHIIDSTAIDARVDLFRLKKETKLGDDDDNYTDRNSPDPDAKFGKRDSGKKTYYGYKEHAVIDGETELFVDVVVTPANVYDGHVLEALIDERAGCITADKAYDSNANHELLKEKRIRSAIIRKSNREYARVYNEAFYNEQRKRPIIERCFANQKMNHDMRRARYLGLGKVSIQAVMTCIVVNMKKLTKMITNEVLPIKLMPEPM